MKNQNNAPSTGIPISSSRPFRLKEPGSAITHFIGMASATLAAPFLLQKAAVHSDPVFFMAALLFITSMILLYMASTLYHAIDSNEHTTLLLKKLDHMMIYVLIAGSYTPICLLTLSRGTGLPMFGIIWGLTAAGLLLTSLWVTSPKWLNSLIYIGMGWVCIFALGEIRAAMPSPAFAWLLAGGIIYTAGGILYALKLPLFNSLHKNFGSHEIFHLFVMGGSLCHFIMVYCYIL